MPAHWKSILCKELARAASETVEAIADDLENSQSDSYARGLKGEAAAALLLADCQRSSAAYRLESALLSEFAGLSSMGLFGGIAGTAWAAHILSNPGDIELLISHFNRTLEHHCCNPSYNDGCDLVSGVAGVGMYISSITNPPTLLATQILSLLERTAIVVSNGIYWTMDATSTSNKPRNHLLEISDLSVAHGMPGIIGMLGRFIESNIFAERSYRLLSLALDWFLSSDFESLLRLNTNWSSLASEPLRLGWCDGELGVAGVLLRVGQILERDDVIEVGVDMLGNLGSSFSGIDMSDPGLCYGVSGGVHIYNMAYQYTENNTFRERAEQLVRRLLALRLPRPGTTTYMFPIVAGNEINWRSHWDLPRGAAGVGLTLLAAAESVDPYWSRLFAL